MHLGEIERKEHLKKYFDKAIPGDAHKYLAKLIKEGIIRFVFTTNFDQTLEKALDELDIDYDVIFSDDILDKTKSWDKVKECRIYKLHGDYKTGKVRNTLSELKTLEPKIAEDFQYIIDRHGLIVIGYSGRDEGVMQHLLQRKPYSYPIYWQFRKMPTDKTEFKLFYDLIDHCDKHIPVKFIQNNSAAGFLSDIISGIENLNQLIVLNSDDINQYRDLIVNHDDKKIRNFSIELSKRYNDIYAKSIQVEDADRHFLHKFEAFKEFISEISFIISYLNELIQFNYIDEAQFILKRVLKPIEINDPHYSEFIRISFPYYLFIVTTALSIKHENLELISKLYQLKYKDPIHNNSESFIECISYTYDGWKHISKEIYKQNYIHPKFSIIQQNLLPDIISKEEFIKADAYILIDTILNGLNDAWLPGSVLFRGELTAVYNEYFEDKLAKDHAKLKEFINNLTNRFSGFGFEYTGSVNSLISTLNQKYFFNKEE